MDLAPGEQAVLKIIRMLFLESSERTHPVTLLRSRWPALHRDAYGGGYMGLIKRGLIAVSSDGERFSVTNAGLRVMAGYR